MSRKILLVDDDPVSLKLVRTLVAGSGHAILMYEDFQEGKRAAEAQRIDMALLGMGTANLNGLAIARSLRDSQLNREAMIIMLGLNEEVGTLRVAFAEGADLVLGKPVNANRIRSVLAAMDSPKWPGRGKVRMPLFTDVDCISGGVQVLARSLNISESGMLLQSSGEVEVDGELQMRFRIPELGASLTVSGRVVRKEEPRRFAVEFTALAPQDQNAIRVYVIGRLKDLTPNRGTSDLSVRRLYPQN